MWCCKTCWFYSDNWVEQNLAKFTRVSNWIKIMVSPPKETSGRSQTPSWQSMYIIPWPTSSCYWSDFQSTALICQWTAEISLWAAVICAFCIKHGERRPRTLLPPEFGLWSASSLKKSTFSTCSRSCSRFLFLHFYFTFSALILNKDCWIAAQLDLLHEQQSGREVAELPPRFDEFGLCRGLGRHALHAATRPPIWASWTRDNYN